MDHIDPCPIHALPTLRLKATMMLPSGEKDLLALEGGQSKALRDSGRKLNQWQSTKGLNLAGMQSREPPAY